MRKKLNKVCASTSDRCLTRQSPSITPDVLCLIQYNRVNTSESKQLVDFIPEVQQYFPIPTVTIIIAQNTGALAGCVRKWIDQMGVRNFSSLQPWTPCIIMGLKGNMLQHKSSPRPHPVSVSTWPRPKRDCQCASVSARSTFERTRMDNTVTTAPIFVFDRISSGAQ